MAVDLVLLATSVATTFSLFLILALSFNLEYGYAGQPNLGKVFFYSVGAYVAGALGTRALWAIAGFPADESLLLSDSGGAMRLAFAKANPGVIVGLFIVSLVLGALAGAAMGYLSALPALRLRGDFLAITLIAVGEVSRVFVLNYRPIAGGEFGLPGVPNPFLWLDNPRLVDLAYAGVVVLFAALSYVFAVRLVNSPYGRLLKALRDDELVASTYGKNAPRVKGEVLAIGSGMAAIAGVLQAYYLGSVSATNYIPIVTFTAVTMVIVGGVAKHRGAVLGAAFVTILDLVTRNSFLFILGISVDLPFDINYLRYLVIGIIIIVVLMFRPKGLLPEGPVETPALDLARSVATPTPAPPSGAADGPPG